MTHIITLDGDIFNNTKTQREIKQWMVSFTVPLLIEHLPSTLVISRSPVGDTECGDQSPPTCFPPPPSCGLVLPTVSLQKLVRHWAPTRSRHEQWGCRLAIPPP